jgi:DtxR family Mn-dependent transcriptional regulator
MGGKNMKCGFCGSVFDPDEAETLCARCPILRDCHLIRCPRCGYEMPPEPRLLRWLHNIRQRRNSKNIPPVKLKELAMKLSDSAQELLERLWIALEEGGKAGLTISNTEPGVDELIGLGLAERENGFSRLTPTGYFNAAQAVRRHRLAERLLADVLATEEGILDERACRLEHALFDGLEESICTLLGHPEFCPHGKPIPRGQCCREMRDSVGQLIAPLSELKPGQKGHIAYMRMSNSGHLQKLMAMGILPGLGITLLSRFPSFVIAAGHSQFAVDEAIAADIYVRLNPTDSRKALSQK